VTSDLHSPVFARRASIRIDTAAIVQNLSSVRARCPLSRVFAVVKADAYGHGAIACANAFAQSDCDALAVVFPAQLKLLDDLKLPRTLQTWLKIDTGMGRMGLAPTDLAKTYAFIADHPQLQCMGLLSHLACADTNNNPHTYQQIDRFKRIELDTNAGPIARSLANSAAVIAWPDTHFDWVRPGIMLYGVNPTNKSNTLDLVPSMEVSAPLTALKLHRKGDGIGYGQCYHCPQSMPVGYVGIGYGDGLPRALSGANLSLHGERVQVIGRVSMDSIAVDLRGVKAQVGDPVVVWGKSNPIERLAEVAGTIAYELLCNIRGNRSYL